tara:strand:- start:26785 stop:27270 length:486 start_codon:yes stop_codon:yes gene_type:complete
MFLLVFVAIVLGFLLIFLFSWTSPSNKQGRSPSDAQEIPEQIIKWTKKDFEESCIAVIKSFGLEISKTFQEKDKVMEIFATNPNPIIGGKYIIHAFYDPPNGIIPLDDILTLSNIIRHEGVSKGIFITAGFFPNNIESSINKSPLELIDGNKLKELTGELQ